MSGVWKENHGARKHSRPVASLLTIKAGLAGFPLFEIDGGGGREGGEEKQTEETVHGGCLTRARERAGTWQRGSSLDGMGRQSPEEFWIKG